MAEMSGTVTSQVKHSPRFRGMIVTPSGRFPSFLDRPRGSFCAGILALPNDLQTTSLIMLWRRCFPFPPLQTSPWSPFASTISRQWWHKCGSQSLTSARLRSGLPRLRDADPELSQEALASSLQSEALVRLADEHGRVERWWTQGSRPILCQYIVDPTLFCDELLYLLVALHLSRLSTPSEHC